MLPRNRLGEDACIAVGLKERDPGAMAQLYDCYGSMVYNRVHSIVQDGAVAEDLAQEVFLRVWNRAESFDETRGSLCGWVLAVARNVALDYLRSRESRLERKAFPLDRDPVFASLLTYENGSRSLRSIRPSSRRYGPAEPRPEDGLAPGF